MSFRQRVVLLAASAVAVAIVIASAAIYFAVRSELRGQVDDELRAAAEGQISFRAPRSARLSPDDRAFRDVLVVPAVGRSSGRAGALRPRPNHAEPELESAATPSLEETLVLPAGPLGGPEVYAQLISPDGDVVRPMGSTIRLPATPTARAVARGETGAYFSDANIDGAHLRLYTAQLGPDRAVQAAQPLDEVDETLSRLLLILGLVSAGGVALAAGLGVVVSRGALGPVARLSTVARDVAETRDLSRRIEESGDDELAELARSFNRMLSELESSVEAQRQLVADASHELRTPLTSLRTNVELLRRVETLGAEQRQRVITDVVEQLEELTALVGDLVDLARYAEQDEERVPLRFDHLVEGMVERARRHAPTLIFDLETEACLVRGAQAALERATFNLLDNAAKWSPPGGRIEVRVTRQGALSVSDQGPGIPEADLPRIFDRFYRAPTARELPGSGLGLAIVRQIAEAHQGRVEASSPSGGGSVLRLWVPSLAARPE